MSSRRRPLDYLQRTTTPAQVWAVEDTAVQVMWGDLPAGLVKIESDNAGAIVEHPGGAGGLTVSGLPADRAVTLRLIAGDAEHMLSTKTLPTPPGELCAVVATVSDLHLVEHSWGFLKTMHEIEPHLEPYATRCAKAAIAEAEAWGAEHLIIKGDAAHHRNPHSYEQLGHVVDAFPGLDMTLIPGNHDVDSHGDIPLPTTVGERQLPYQRGVAAQLLGGANIVTVDTTVEENNHGSIAERTALVAEALKRDAPNLVLLHHHLQKASYPRFWPPGIPGPEADEFLAAVEAASQQCLITSGHTHRNRRRDVNSTVITEVGSTKDWPGVWAGYAIHEGGIRQVIRRVEHPAAARWHEFSRHAVLGLWSRWAPGPIGQRCFTHVWNQHG